ncbi:hypothetical protein A5641_22875 [Mycobacterium sp. 1554424.7]|nr:hypothetical protein A5641_22875 [Mycobacterium sp. 1554424.7]
MFAVAVGLLADPGERRGDVENVVGPDAVADQSSVAGALEQCAPRVACAAARGVLPRGGWRAGQGASQSVEDGALFDVGVEPDSQRGHGIGLVEEGDTEPMQVGERVVDDRQHQRIAGREVPIQGAGADAGRARDVVERCGHAVPQKGIAGAFEQGLAVTRRIGPQLSPARR